MKRMRHFSGQLLTAADFAAEQQYFGERQRRHNRCLHGWGIVRGLEVRVAAEGRGQVLRVEPGCALDCLGDELFVPDPVVSSVPPAAEILYVGLLLTERETDWVLVAGGPVPEESTASRIEELPSVTVTPEDPCPQHRGRRGRKELPCGLRHPVPVARLQWHRCGWNVDPRFALFRARS